ncbi:XRE family transcriptional regulator [Brevibacillus laterosporus]|nr:helix-turn-helix transcriptional regulator [Brevibacillus laterosporus]TPG70514.1 XRE family transcriptional regulator [Brevibacillus laterosporus]TPG87746.1 XRE family transcriptional regulator [Brevibacillus laterosporus]
MGLSTLLYTTLGEYIRNKRLAKGMSLSELSRRTGVSKGVLSKIESGETRHPQLRTLKAIGDVINMPKDQLIDMYITDEKNLNVIQELLEDAISLNNLETVKKVALHFLSSPEEDSYVLMQHLFDITSEVANSTTKLELYSVIVQYARERGMQGYLAKGLLFSYLIERDDFTRLGATYLSAKYMLHYLEFLSTEERVIAYYKLGVHAFNLGYFEETIELCMHVVEEYTAEDNFKAGALMAIINSYYNLGNYTCAWEYLHVFSKLPQSEGQLEVEALNAMLDGKMGRVDIDVVIEKLRKCLALASDNQYLHIVNELYQLLMHKNDIDVMDELEEVEEKIKGIKLVTPYKRAELALFYKLKGDFYVGKELYREASNYYIRSLVEYGKIGSYDKGYANIEKILNICATKLADAHNDVLEKLSEACAIFKTSITK